MKIVQWAGAKRRREEEKLKNLEKNILEIIETKFAA